ncbi:MAG: hypothetical protein EZS28_013594, partial [Streblomastix strix]
KKKKPEKPTKEPRIQLIRQQVYEGETGAASLFATGQLLKQNGKRFITPSDRVFQDITDLQNLHNEELLSSLVRIEKRLVNEALSVPLNERNNLSKLKNLDTEARLIQIFNQSVAQAKAYINIQQEKISKYFQPSSTTPSLSLSPNSQIYQLQIFSLPPPTITSNVFTFGSESAVALRTASCFCALAKANQFQRDPNVLINYLWHGVRSQFDEVRSISLRSLAFIAERAENIQRIEPDIEILVDTIDFILRTSPLPVAVSGLLFARSVFNIDLNSRLAYVELHPFSTLHEIFQLLYKESEKMSLLLDQEELSIVRQQANKQKLSWSDWGQQYVVEQEENKERQMDKDEDMKITQSSIVQFDRNQKSINKQSSSSSSSRTKPPPLSNLRKLVGQSAKIILVKEVELWVECLLAVIVNNDHPWETELIQQGCLYDLEQILNIANPQETVFSLATQAVTRLVLTKRNQTINAQRLYIFSGVMTGAADERQTMLLEDVIYRFERRLNSAVSCQGYATLSDSLIEQLIIGFEGDKSSKSRMKKKKRKRIEEEDQDQDDEDKEEKVIDDDSDEDSDQKESGQSMDKESIQKMIQSIIPDDQWLLRLSPTQRIHRIMQLCDEDGLQDFLEVLLFNKLKGHWYTVSKVASDLRALLQL